MRGGGDLGSTQRSSNGLRVHACSQPSARALLKGGLNRVKKARGDQLNGFFGQELFKRTGVVKGRLERFLFFFKRVCPKRFKYWGGLPVCSEIVTPEGGSGFLKPGCYI
jgi:hypothetical protein